MENKNAFGARVSPYDQRTVVHQAEATAPLVKGGVEYVQGEHLNQYNEGICTADWLIQNRQKANGKKYSYDFQYLLQKKFFDLEWDEGSSIFYSLKVGKNYGFLPAELWTHTTEADLQLPYSEYVAKLQAVPDAEVTRLLGLCVDKIAGYAQVDVTDPQAIAKAIVDSEVGIGCRYEVAGPEWWNPQNPLQPPATTPTEAHAIGMPNFDYSVTVNLDQGLANSWGDDWNENGNATANWNTYKPSEAWIILKTAPVIAEPTIKIGAKGQAVIDLQTDLNSAIKANLVTDGNFGPKTQLAVINYQKIHGLAPDGIVGAKTWAALTGVNPNQSVIETITEVCTENGIEPQLGIAVATCESGLNPKATLYNPGSKSTDRGLYQWNSLYHAEISDAQAFDPTQATELFCKAVQAGKLTAYWSASEPNWKKMLSPELLTKYGIV